MRHLTFVTSNDNKVWEAEHALGVKLRRATIELDEIQELDLSRIIEHKAKQAYSHLKRPVMVEDAGLYVKEWGGFPGPFIKWVQETIGYKKLPKLLPKRNRLAEWVVAYGLYDGKKFRAFEGKVRGTIAERPRGRDGWGFDPLFIPNGRRQTYAEMGPAEKMKISARQKALGKLRKFLRGSTERKHR